jgi:nitric oxide reductase subunit B
LLQVAGLVVIVGFFVLILLAYRTYESDPPIPDRATDTAGNVVYTGDDVSEGQKIFLNRGLMEYGSIFGHGAYLGPDFTADYLHRSSASVRDQLGGEGSDSARQETIDQFQSNEYDPETKTLPLSDQQTQAFTELEQHYTRFFATDTTRFGLRPEPVKDPEQIHDLTAFFAWSAWAASARRPGHNYSYTNNWPPEKQVGNEPSANVIVWSVISLIALLGGIGILFAAFGRWRMGWAGHDQATLTFRAPGDVALTPAQRATAWFFFVMAALFLLQTLVGGLSQHYRADLEGFFGIDIAQALPFNLVRTWHVQLAIFFVATSFVAAGIFLAPMIAGREPRGQAPLAFALLGALAVVVFGSLFGELAGVHDWFSGSIFGLQGFEYLDLGRFWQVLLVIGLCVWIVILFRGLRGRLSRERVGNMPWLFFIAALAIPAFYAVGLLARAGDSFTITDYWRFWVVHLWVEDFLELFTTVMVAYIFVLLGVVRERVALLVVFLDIILYSVGGVIGTMHHLYFSGAPAENMARGGLLGARGDAAHLPDGRGLELPPARRPAGVEIEDAVPAPLGGDVPGRGRVLELPRRGDLRLPDQPADRLLLRDRHRADRQPRAHGDDGRLRDARGRTGDVLPAVSDPGRALERARGEDELLRAQHRARLDGVCHLVPARDPAAI